jgi:hypothetical protein
MNPHTYLIFFLIAIVPGTASAGTMSFNDLDFGDNVLKIYYLNGSGTILNETIYSNGTAHINSPNDYVVVIQPENIDVLNNPTALNPYLRSALGIMIFLAAFGGLIVLYIRLLKGGIS